MTFHSNVFHNTVNFLPLIAILSLAIFLNSCRTTEPPERPEYIFHVEAEEDRPPLVYYDDVDHVEIDSLLAEMTLDEKIGQLFISRAYGRFSNDREPELMRLKRLIEEFHIGGVIFSSGDVYDQAVMNNKLQKISKIPLWITQDMEFGAAMRVRSATRFTPAMGVAATGNPFNAYLTGRVTAYEAKALGVHQIFAPVLDVNNNPDNPVINVRSYGAEPAMVSEYGIRFMEGAEQEGVMATGKHFPGHGDTDVDSHLALPTIPHDYTRLDTLELVPFRNAINSGMRSVMSAHIAFPNVSKNIDLPGTLDESILNRILVDSLGFDGLIITDGLEMSGITDHYSPGEAVVMALLAGADLMLISPDEKTAIQELKTAVEAGRISELRIDQSVRKLLELKKMHRVFQNRFVDLDDLSHKINTPQFQTIAERIARESVTVLKNDQEVLPIREIDYPSVLLISVSDGNVHSSASVLANQMRRYHSNVRHHSIDDRTTDEEVETLLREARRADLIVIGSFIMVRSYHPIQMPERQLDILNQVAELDSPNLLMAFGNPYVVRDLPEAHVHLLAWASDANQVRQTVPSLFGASAVQGTFPGNIPGMYNIGDGLNIEQSVVRHDRPEAAAMTTDSLLNIDMIMQEAINDSVFPGGVVGVMRNGSLVWEQGYGYHDYFKTQAVQNSDIYDLASVTKVMATTLAIMKLVDEGQLSLDDPVANYIEEFRAAEKQQITIRHFLLHTSGLPAYRNYVDTYRTRAEILNAVRNEPLVNRPGEEYTYSDLGFILLGEIVDIVSGKRLDQFVRDEFYRPMGLNSIWFNPKQGGSSVSSRIAPTEIDAVFHRGLVHQYVHDERAYWMDGIAGHAGLFSSVQDLAKLSYMLLNDGIYGGHRYLSPETIKLFTSHQSPINHRGLGFDRKSENEDEDEDFISSAGNLTGPDTFGHLGFTGTSIWLDPDEELAIILLTNRVHPNRNFGRNIREIRANIADAVMKSIKH